MGGQEIEYRIGHLQNRLAADGLAELGMRIETHGASVTIRGTVPTAGCRDELLRAAHEELAGLEVHTDIQITEATPPGAAEELT
ncbi:hypothetical protein EAO77_16715 [Streptomyces sp. t39]|nr:hypothetical protein EAO77_16715 [Streptomyces sp. t39]